jgi:hypothetical protein
VQRLNLRRSQRNLLALHEYRERVARVDPEIVGAVDLGVVLALRAAVVDCGVVQILARRDVPSGWKTSVS